MTMRGQDLMPRSGQVTPAVQRDLHRYAGRWVAITRNQVVADGDSPDAALNKARNAGCDDPIIYRVPLPDEATVSYF